MRIERVDSISVLTQDIRAWLQDLDGALVLDRRFDA
jgi:hypothetical protein